MHLDQELLFNFFDRQTTYEEEVAIRKWINLSDENQKEFFRQRKLFDAIILNGDIDKPKKQKSWFISSKRVLMTACGVAAIVLLTVVVTVEYMKQSFLSKSTNSITVPQGQRVNLKLSDGTIVWLNAKTQMEYPQTFFSSENRVVKLDGEAYFEVTKNLKKPFIVKTAKGSVEVLGTKFFVNAYTASDNFETALMEGKVNVQTPTGDIVLYPNEKAVLKDGKLVKQKIVNMDRYRWRDGLFCFNNLTFDEVLKQLEIYYDVRFVKENAQLNYPSITGKFRLVDGVDYALRVLQKEMKFSYLRDDDTNIIYLR